MPRLLSLLRHVGILRLLLLVLVAHGAPELTCASGTGAVESEDAWPIGSMTADAEIDHRRREPAPQRAQVGRRSAFDAGRLRVIFSRLSGGASRSSVPTLPNGLNAPLRN